MKVLVLVDLSPEELKNLDEDCWITKNGLVLTLPATSRKCAVEECYGNVGSSGVYCSAHTNYEGNSDGKKETKP